MLFELLPYPMHIVITFLKPPKFYITSNNQRPVRSTSGKVGGARLRPFMVIALSKCKKKLRDRDQRWLRSLRKGDQSGPGDQGTRGPEMAEIVEKRGPEWTRGPGDQGTRDG